MDNKDIPLVILPILSALLSSYITLIILRRAKKKYNERSYDVFISYSSKDSKQVSIIQQFLENYNPPASLSGKAQNLKIKVFRDKSDQGTSSDYLTSFTQMIDNIHSFLLVGSENSRKSGPVGAEVEHFISNGRGSINLAWLDADLQQAFPSVVLEKYPRALYADIRILKTSTHLSWFFTGRKKFKTEMLRILAHILSVKTGSSISFETLMQREKQRKQRRLIRTMSVMIIAIAALFVYYLNTPAFAWQYTSIEKTGVLSLGSVVENKKVKVRVRSSLVLPYENGDSGENTRDTIYQINETGEIEGTISYTTFNSEVDDDFKTTGVFAGITRDQFERIIAPADEIVRFRLANFDSLYAYRSSPWDSYSYAYDSNKAFHIRETKRPINLFMVLFTSDRGKTWTITDTVSIFTNGIQKIWKPTPYNGTLFIATQTRTDHDDFFYGGIYRSDDYGRTWNTLSPFKGLSDWTSFSSVISCPGNPGYFAVVLDKNDQDNTHAPFDNYSLIPSPWITYDNGTTWKLLTTPGEKLEAGSITLIGWSQSGNIFAIMSGKLVIYKKRSFWDRLLKRFDDV